MAAQQHMPFTITSTQRTGKPVAPAERDADDRRLSTEGTAKRCHSHRNSHTSASPAHAAELEFAATLLPLWGLAENTEVSLVDEQGVNNQTFLVRHRHSATCCESPGS